MNKFTFFASLFTLFISLTSCDNDDYQPVDDTAEVLNLPAVSFDYENLNLPNHFTIDAPGPLPTAINDIDNTPINNPVTDAGATLGRVLFYDKKLSANGTIACASCHIQEKGFSDDAVLSVGFDGGLTRRHSMTLINARYYQRGRYR